MEINEIKIIVEYVTSTSRGKNDFKNLQELKRWLEKNPQLATALGYVKK